MRRKKPVETAEPTINITPLIDVVFVILIAFIIVAPLLERDQVQLASGENHEAVSMHETSPITIHVRADNTILINGRQIASNDLKKELFNEHQLHPNAHPQVFHDKRAQFGTYQSLKNTLEQLGFDEMDIVLAPG